MKQTILMSLLGISFLIAVGAALYAFGFYGPSADDQLMKDIKEELMTNARYERYPELKTAKDDLLKMIEEGKSREEIAAARNKMQTISEDITRQDIKTAIEVIESSPDLVDSPESKAMRNKIKQMIDEKQPVAEIVKVRDAYIKGTRTRADQVEEEVKEQLENTP